MRRDGKIYKQSFKSNIEGAVPTSEVLVEKDPVVPQVTGTIIIYKPDKLVYGDIFIDIPKLEQMLQFLLM